MKPETRKEKGLSLIELLIYLAIFSLLLALVVQFLFEVKSLQMEAQSFSFLNREGRSIFLEIQREIRNAQSIAFPNPGEAGNSLSLNSGEIIYSLNEEGILEKNTASQSWPIHSSKIIIDELIFERGANPNQTENIKIKMNLKSRLVLEGKRERSLNLQTTVSLR